MPRARSVVVAPSFSAEVAEVFLAGREEQRTIAKTISRGGIAAKLSPIKEACLSARSIHPSSAFEERILRGERRGENQTRAPGLFSAIIPQSPVSVVASSGIRRARREVAGGREGRSFR